MAKIPVEQKKGGLPWWAWLLIALLVAALAWWLIAALNDDEEVAVTDAPDAAVVADEPEAVAPVADPDAAAGSGDGEVGAPYTGRDVAAGVVEEGTAAGAAAGGMTDTGAEATASLDDVLVIIGDQDPGALVGRNVTLENVEVQRVPGDVTFWIGPNADQQLLVVLDEVSTPQDATTEGRYDINPGQMVTIFGELRQFPGVDEATSQWNIGDRTGLDGLEVYLHADRVEILSR